MIPAFTDAKDDRDLRGSPMTVYLYLLDELDPAQWKEVPQLATCVRLGISERTVRDALDVLTAKGYLERTAETAHAGKPRMYRLVYKRLPSPPSAA